MPRFASWSRRPARRAAAATAASLALALTAASPALAAPDYDGDGFTTDDCQPLDAAVHPGAVDRPDLSAEDTNCDGIDGDLTKAFFVSTAGSDAGTGSLEAPFKTVTDAINQAASASPKRSVYVEAGSYTEHVVLTTGVSVYGGYLPSGARPSDQVSSIVAPAGEPEAILGISAQGVELQRLDVKAASAATPGASSYGIRIAGGSTVALTSVTSTGGAAGNGAAGSNGPLTLTVTAAGTCGGQFFRMVGPTLVATCPGGAFGPSNNANGGAGGATAGGIGDGGKGGDGVTSGNGQAGQAGKGPGGGLGGAGGAPRDLGMFTTCVIGNPCVGRAGQTPAAGADGTHGSNALFSVATAGVVWTNVASATAGLPGSLGSGGGGGGSGRFAHDAGCNLDISGGAGGGGGAGGLGGNPGSAGASGGGSFGLYVAGSTVVVDGGTLTGGAGGTGGRGGNGRGGIGGAPGGPGQPGRTNTATGCSGTSSFAGGDGGTGGVGGTGGGGGGGAGGPSLGAFATSTSTITTTGNAQLVGGAAGAGGAPGEGGTPPATPPAAGVSAGLLGQPGAGTAPGDFDHDGVADAIDRCPSVGLDAGGVDAGADGCPDRVARLADRDGDGIPDTVDGCPDTSAATCGAGTVLSSGTRAAGSTPPAAAAGTLKITFKPSAGFTSLTALRVSGVAKGGKVTLTCSGAAKASCPFKTRTLTLTAGAGSGLRTKTIRVRGKKVKQSIAVRFGVGAVLQVRISAPGALDQLVGYAMRARKQPTRLASCPTALPGGVSIVC